jgi:hypothetical protein
MYESPSCLEDLCLDAICDNILLYVKSDHTTNNDLNKGKRYKFADSDLFLFKEISEKLLGKFIEKNILCDALMFLFNENNTKLSTVKLKNCKVTQTGLQILKQHKILDLECVNLKNVCIGNILGESSRSWRFSPNQANSRLSERVVDQEHEQREFFKMHLHRHAEAQFDGQDHESQEFAVAQPISHRTEPVDFSNGLRGSQIIGKIRHFWNLRQRSQPAPPPVQTLDQSVDKCEYRW